MVSAAAPSEFSLANAHPYDLRSPGRWTLSHVLRYRVYLVLVGLAAVANAAGAFMVPALIGRAFNVFLEPGRDLVQIGHYALLIAFSQIIRGAVLMLRNASSETLAQRMERDVREELYVSLLGKSMTFHSMQAVGDIMARATNDVREMNLMLNPGFNLLIGSGMFLVMPLFLSPAIHPHLLLTPVLFIVGLFISVRVYSSQLAPLTELVRGRFGTLNAGLAEAVDGIETVKGASQETQEIARFTRNATAFRDAFVRQSDVEARFVPLLLLGIANGTAFLHAILLFQAGLITVGDVIAYMGYLQLFGFPVWTSLFAISQFSLGLAAGRRIFALITARTDLDANPRGHSGAIRGTVRFEHVTFSYPGGSQPALAKVSFEAQPRQVIAIVGQTGAGKSTVARLINRTFDPQVGRVLIDGIDARNWQLEALRSQISIIEQDIFLFSRTIAENIAFGNPRASEDQIVKAAKAAQAHDFILGFRDGYDTVIGERGVTLSGGQRQRIALARAFLTNPRILILDDSTSAIDSATEDQIQRAILHATQGRTTFLITHRLSQIRWADQIVVLRKGVVAAIGTHEELLRSSEAYRRIFATYEAADEALPPAEGAR